MCKNLELVDDFADDCAMGDVIYGITRSGHRRLGIDIEKIMSVDNGSLRIAPLIKTGFGRAAISYGPFSKKNGFAFAVSILNGHNTSQAEQLPDTFRERIDYWIRGSENDPKLQRLFCWLRSGRVKRTLRQFRWWKHNAKGSNPVPLLNENLAVGLFSDEYVPDPRLEGHSFIMHALGAENGELWIGQNGCRNRVLRGVQNLPLYLVGVLREGGIVYYISSIDGVPGVANYPEFQPVAVEYGPLPPTLYLGIHQGVLGQIGFRLDTRINEVRVGHLCGYESWFGGAHAADILSGKRIFELSQAETGGEWQIFEMNTQHIVPGANEPKKEKIAIIDPGAPSGLIHAEIQIDKDSFTESELVWRFIDENNYWLLKITSRTCEIVLVSEGIRRILAKKEYVKHFSGGIHRLQVLDTGNEIMAYCDGEPLTDSWVRETRFEAATGIGIILRETNKGDFGTVRRFEAHPRCCRFPECLNMGSPWLPKGNGFFIADDFDGPKGDLQGRKVSIGEQHWARAIGSGVIELTGDGRARIRGSVEEPSPGRTAYCIDWVNPEFADLEVTITPPGSRKGEGERGMAGFILYQDNDNYVTINIWRTDYYDGSSISTFFKYDGFEDLYDAIWTNVGDRVFYGKPSRLRLVCDGEQYLVFVNDEPVLYRAFRDVYPDFRRLVIRKVGLLANWEFGTDTGSRFEQFKART